MQKTEQTYINLSAFSVLETWSVQALLENKVSYNKKFPLARIGEFLTKSRETISVEDDITYKRVTVRINNGGVKERDTEIGKNIGTKNQFIAHAGQFIVSRIDARNGAFGIIPEELEGAIVTNDFPLFNVNTTKILSEFLLLITTTKKFVNFAQSCSSGTTNRQRMDIDLFLNQKIPLPPISEQEKIVNAYNAKIKQAKLLEKQAKTLEKEIDKYLLEKLGIKTTEENKNKKGLQLFSFQLITEWGIDKIKAREKNSTSFFKISSVADFSVEIFRGKSPIYKDNTNAYILNQKCNRWNTIDMSFVKTVDETWLNSIDEAFFTKEGDIIINSTGEGTIGRATYISKDFEGLLYDSHILLLRLNKRIINPELFVELFNSPYGQNQVNDIKSAQATKQTELGVSNLTKINMPIPDSIDLQKEIIEITKGHRATALINRNKAMKLLSDAQLEFETEIFGK